MSNDAPEHTDAELRQIMLDHASAGTLLKALFEQYGDFRHKEDDPVVRVLAGLHNEGAVDLLALLTPASLAQFGGHNFFEGQGLYCALIPQLETPANDLVVAVENLIDAAGADGMATMPVNDFGKWLSRDPARPTELLALVDANFSGADRFLTLALKYGAAFDRPLYVDRSYQFLEQGSGEEKQAAARALAQFDLKNADEWRRWLGAFAAAAARDADDEVRAALLDAVAGRFLSAPKSRHLALTDVGTALLDPPGELVLDRAARALGNEPTKLPLLFIDALLAALLAIRPAMAGSLGYALMTFLRVDPDRTRNFVERLLRRKEDPVEARQLKSFWHILGQAEPAVQAGWVVAWLLEGHIALCNALNDALFDGGAEELPFVVDFSSRGLRDSDYPYLARKAIGTFFLKPVLMASLVAGLLRSAPLPAAEEISELLANPVLRNYGGTAHDYLAEIAGNPADPAAAFVAAAIQRHEAYIAGLEAIGAVSELHPSERERTLEWQRHSDAMEEAFREARKKSIFAGIVHESTLLYGARSISWFRDIGGEWKRVETPLGSISHSIEMPRVDIIDPMNLNRMLRMFQAEERPE